MDSRRHSKEASSSIRIKGIPLPSEHGAWGFLAEPLVAALAIAWSGAGAWIALMVVGAFLSRQPLKIFLGDTLSGRRLPQTNVARRFALIFILISSLGFAGTTFNGRMDSLWPFSVVLPFALIQIYFDAKRQSRELVAEVIGAFAMSSSAAAILLADGQSVFNAIALWAVFFMRLVTSIIYVRNRLRAEKGKKFSFITPLSAHLFAGALVVSLSYLEAIPFLIGVAFILLLVRSTLGLSNLRKPTRAMKIGMLEVLYGALLVIAVIVGSYLGW